MFAERMRYMLARTTSLTISAGVATVTEGDDVKVFLTRADSALYAAKASGRNAVYCHNGQDAFPAASQDLMAAPAPAAGRRHGAQESSPETPIAEEQSS